MIIKLCEHHVQYPPCGKITIVKITSVLEYLKLRKSPGYDSCTNEHIKHGGKILTKCILKLFNKIVCNDKIPTEWKQGLIIPIYKEGGKPKTLARVTDQWPCCQACSRFSKKNNSFTHKRVYLTSCRFPKF